MLFGVPLLQNVYLAGINSGLPNAVLRSVCCAVCLLPPTILMGATLPLIARWVESTPSAAAWWGYFYGANIAGGVVGCFLAGFYLLRVFDMSIASYLAASINLVIALASFAILNAVGPVDSDAAATAQSSSPPATRPWDVYFTIGISGLTALGAEVVWTRLLSLMLGPTTYTFSIILGVFLAGLGIGSALGSRVAQKKGNPRMLLISCQILIALCLAWAGILLALWLPYWKGNLNSEAGPWVGFVFDIWRSILPILPPALLWGASFPIALACAAENETNADSGRIVGEIYGANTVGAIIGAVFFSLVFIPRLSLHGSEQLLMAIALIGAVALTGFSVKNLKPQLVGFVLAIALIVALPATPWKLIGFGRRLPTTEGNWNLLYTTDGMNSSIAYSQWEHDTTYFHVTGKVEASTEPQDMSLQRMLGHLPAILHTNPRSILVVGCGAGVTAGSFVVHPEVEHITICEIEPKIPPATAKYFGDANHHVIDDPRTKVVYDDARHYVLTADQKFDIITSDPIHPWVKGMASLYTTEYFELCKKHLNPGGIVTQWVPLYESSFETVQSELATFFEAFPHGTIWGNLNTDGTGYDVVLMGQVDALPINVDALQTKLADPKYAAVRKSLSDVGFPSVLNLLSTYAANASDLRGMDADRAAQSRPQPAAAVSGWPGAESEPGAGNLPGDHQRPEIPEQHFFGFGGRDKADCGYGGTELSAVARLATEPTRGFLLKPSLRRWPGRVYDTGKPAQGQL